MNKKGQIQQRPDNSKEAALDALVAVPTLEKKLNPAILEMVKRS